MSDNEVTEEFRELRKISQERRAANRERGVQVLRDERIAFITRNDGAHLIVTHQGETVDYWPGTGKWIARAVTVSGGKRKEARGVRQLIHWLKRHEPV